MANYSFGCGRSLGIQAPGIGGAPEHQAEDRSGFMIKKNLARSFLFWKLRAISYSIDPPLAGGF